MHSKLFLLLTVCCLALVSARGTRDPMRRDAVKNTRKAAKELKQRRPSVTSPRVDQSYSGNECGCLSLGGTSTICCYMTPPMVQVGWQTNQVFSTQSSHNYWQLTFEPYVQAYVVIEWVVEITNMYYNVFTISVPQFMTNVFLESYIYDDGTICLNTGWMVQDILLSIETDMSF